jgi:hypothetical protein
VERKGGKSETENTPVKVLMIGLTLPVLRESQWEQVVFMPHGRKERVLTVPDTSKEVEERDGQNFLATRMKISLTTVIPLSYPVSNSHLNKMDIFWWC